MEFEALGNGMKCLYAAAAKRCWWFLSSRPLLLYIPNSGTGGKKVKVLST